MKYKLLITSALLSCLGALPAISQTQVVPEFLQNMEGLVYHGDIGGMSMYSADGFAGNWFVTPDGKMAIAGAMFGPTGRDIGAALTGSAPIEAFEMGRSVATTSDKSTGDEPGLETNNIPADNSQISDLSIDEMEEGVAKIEAEMSKKPWTPSDSKNLIESTDSETSVESTQDETSLSGMLEQDGAALIENAQDALNDFSPKERSQLLQLLIEMLNDVTTEVEFKAAVRAWTEEIAFLQAEKSGIPLPPDMLLKAPMGVVLGDYDGDGVVDEEPIVSSTNSDEILLPVGDNPSTLDDALNAEIVEEASASMNGEDQLLKDMAERTKTDSFWFAIGAEDAPVIYAYIDPDCPFCARAINNLDASVKNGDFQLRILLAPVVSQRSPDLIAGILTAENPEEVFWNHEITKVNGDPSPLTPGDWGALPEEGRAAVLKNVDILLDFEVPGVPFFIFETEEGLKYANGVPVPETFAGALPDDFNGN